MTATSRSNRARPRPATELNGYKADNWRIGGTTAELIDSPLDYILAEHRRQRVAAAMLIMIADGEFDRSGIANLVQFLRDDFTRHISDEERAFFPALRAACVLDDDIDELISRLSEEHGRDEALCREALEILARRLAGSRLSAEECDRIRYFAEHIRQHLALENGALLPIARARLTDNDLKQLAQALKRLHAN